MEIASKRISYRSRKDIFEVIPISDIHLGNAGCDLEKLQECVDYIKGNPKCYWYLLGDACECIVPGDKRFDPRSIDKRYLIYDLSHLIRRQIDDVLQFLSPIKERCLAVFSGNHEESIRKASSYDPAQQIAYELGAKYMGYDGFIVLYFARHGTEVTTLTIYANHGHGMGRKDGSKANMLSDAAKIFDAQLITIGHGHKKIIGAPVTRIALNADKTNIVAKKQYTLMTGGFLRGYQLGATSYVSKMLLDPSDLGWCTISVKPNFEDFKIEVRGT